jgi:hypothetical protein
MMKEGGNHLHSHANGDQEISGPQKINSPQRDLLHRSLVAFLRAQSKGWR